MTIVGIAATKLRLSELIALAIAGEEVIITKRGKPVARLLPVAPRDTRRIAGIMKDKWPSLPDSFFFDPLPEDELALWEGSGDDPLDASFPKENP